MYFLDSILHPNFVPKVLDLPSLNHRYQAELLEIFLWKPL